MKLSVIIPVYNEIDTIQSIIQKVQNVDIEKELIIVDDFSSDGTREHLLSLNNDKDVLIEKNGIQAYQTGNIRVVLQQ